MTSCRRHLARLAVSAAALLSFPSLGLAAVVANPLCPNNTAFFNPDHAQDIMVPDGFKISVFASGLNAPTGIAFRGDSRHFQVFVLESGHGLPSDCNDQTAFGSGDFDPTNPLRLMCWSSTRTANALVRRSASPPRRASDFNPKVLPSTSRLNMGLREDACSRPIRTRRRISIMCKTIAR